MAISSEQAADNARGMQEVQERVAVIKTALMRSTFPPSDSSSSSWVHALAIVAGEMIQTAPQAARGLIIEDVQNTLMLIARGGRPTGTIMVPTSERVGRRDGD